MFECETNDPMTTGQPGDTSCASAIPVSASAVCCASDAATDTGPIAPIRMNGVTTTTWRASASTSRESSMMTSKRSGEFALITPNSAGDSAIASRPPWAIAAIAMESAQPTGLNWAAANGLSVSVASEQLEVEMARLDVQIGRFADRVPGRVELVDHLGEAHEVPEVVDRRVAPDARLAHEGRALTRAEGHAIGRELQAATLTAPAQHERARRLPHLLEHPLGVELHDVVLDVLAGRAEALEHALVLELHADLGDQTLPAALERDEAGFREQLEGR